MFNQACLAQVSGWCQVRSSVLLSLVHPTVQTRIEHHGSLCSHCSGFLNSSMGYWCLQVRLSRDDISWDQRGQPGLAVFTLGGPPTVTGYCGHVCSLLRHTLFPTSSFFGQPFRDFPSTLETCLGLQILVQRTDLSPTEGQKSPPLFRRSDHG